ncbi:hypothetical protein NB466_00165 [Vibrio fluvialis]|jgi:hypothetical protein|uniref:hypothetical protein n=1 Tax=Vibrio TaxID=662 RepID=UPI0003674E00|nr:MULTISPECIES: hypothetical protein [Vibrio]HDV5624527.1 hypothetical protein [Vibrio cholerae]ELC3209971.1 hypothetical protein [Vibrio parahaemolyticus]MCC3836137.1 hypothetical protein [Vibrio parahaemolyticus]MCG6414583.1 hypothetical protein [Vibrio fluvialis]MCR9297286.1 hypothetical protein [Vibrio fluvialis]
MRYTFTSAQEAHDFAYDKGIPFTRIRNLSEMNSRELTGLRIQRNWVLGIRTQYCSDEESQKWYHVDREYISLDSFRIENNELVEKRNVVILGYYCYQLSHDPTQVIHLEELSRVSLSTQLMQYTGDGYSSLAFHSEDDTNCLSASGVIVHKRTQQRFFVPAAPLDRFE